jgi:hypothetical protein
MKTALLLLSMMMCVAAWGSDREPNCNREHSNFGDDMETFTSQEQFTVPMAGLMKVTAAHNGGVILRSGTGSAYEVTVCKYAGAESESEGNQVLGQIHGEHTGNTIGVKGPDSEHRWVAQLIIKVPQGANMSVAAYNGPISAKELNGTFELNTVNGPISVNNVSGKVNAVAKNGPISFHGEKGDYNLESQNGPLSIELESQSWQGGRLEAKSQNGPVSLALPKGYQSGVVLTTDGHGPMSCDAEVCGEARKTWDNDEKRIEFGPGNAVIRISTHNGPVSVSAHRAEM